MHNLLPGIGTQLCLYSCVYIAAPYNNCTVSGCPSILCAQALFGIFLFGESVSLVWWLGASLVVTGLVIMQYGTSETAHKKVA